MFGIQLKTIHFARFPRSIEVEYQKESAYKPSSVTLGWQYFVATVLVLIGAWFFLHASPIDTPASSGSVHAQLMQSESDLQNIINAK